MPEIPNALEGPGDAMSSENTQQHGDGSDHSPFLAHHWDTPKQQFEAGKLGMWLFLATEVLLFGGLFCWYTIAKSHNPEVFQYGHHFLDKKWGAINTMVLLFSSLTMAMAVRESQLGRTKRLLFYLAMTFLCGAGFMGIKFVEYTKKFDEGLFPGSKFSYQNVIDAEDEREEEKLKEERLAQADSVFVVPAPTAREPVERSTAKVPAGLATQVAEIHGDGHGDDSGHEEGSSLPLAPSHLPTIERPRDVHKFFSVYFCMTGLHGIHVLIGMGVMVWLSVLAVRGRFSPDYFTPVDLGGLYWHLVDLIWIYLFPLLYLVE